MIKNPKILKHLENKPYKNSDELCKLLAQKNDTVILSFSRGKDSIAAWLKLRRFFKRVIPIYFYNVPNLSFVNKSIEYYENYFETKIIQLPNPSFIHQLNSGMFQTLNNALSMIKLDIPNLKNDDFFNIYKEQNNLSLDIYTALGIRATDNLQRWTAFVTNGCVNEKRKTFFSIFDYSIKSLEKELIDAKIKMPIDYKLWGKSFDAMQYRFIVEIKKHFPEDYEKIKEYFPLIDIEILRYEN